MKKFAIKILVSALNLFSGTIVSLIPSEWVKRVAELSIVRLKLFGEALVDADPNDKDQIEKIARETLVSPEFQNLERQLTLEVVSKIPNVKLGNVLLGTENLRLQFFAVLGDDNKDNGVQIKELFESFLKSEEFDTMAITFAELLADKYAKNDLTRQFIINLVTSLVNSDDNN